MASTTTNYGLRKIDLTDAPPDITVLNQNWDKIDTLFGDTWFKTATVIPSGANLNDYSDIGMYIYSAGSAAAMTNVPEVAQGTLLVLPRLSNDDPNNIIQLVISRENSVYVRNKYDGTWKDWDKIVSEAMLNTVLGQVTVGSIGAQPLHYYYEVTDIGCTNASTASQVWNALPDRSVLVYQASSLTDASWNLPTQLGIIRIEKYALNRGLIQLFSKVSSNKDYRMYLDDTTGEPTGTWYEYYTSGNKPTPSSIGALDKQPSFIEFNTPTTANHGGYIDFHYNGSTSDYTSRIMEGSSGKLSISAPNGVEVSSPPVANALLRNIYGGTTEMTSGSTTLATGSIYLTYK